MFLSRREQLHTKTCKIWIRFTCWKCDMNHFALTCSIKFGDKMIGFMGQSKLESCWILPFCGQIPQGFPRLRPVGPRIIRLIQFVQNSVKLLLQRLNSLESSTDMPYHKNLETSEFCIVVDSYTVPHPVPKSKDAIEPTRVPHSWNPSSKGRWLLFILVLNKGWGDS